MSELRHTHFHLMPLQESVCMSELRHTHFQLVPLQERVHV